MTQGIVVTLPDLIALKGLVHKANPAYSARKIGVGQHAAKARGRGMAIADIRHYQAGDEIRHMEWRVTARTGRPHIKVFEEERERPILMLIDFSHSMYFGTRGAFKSAIAARLAGLLAWTAMQQGDKVGGVLLSQDACHEFRPKLRHQSILPFLSAIATCTHMPHSMSRQPLEFALALSRTNQLAQSGGLVILISDFYGLNAACLSHLSRLRTHQELLALQVCDPLELTTPPPGRYPISNGTQTCWLDLRSADNRRMYETACKQRLDLLQSQLQPFNIPLHQVTAATPLDQLVPRIFPRRAHA
jgi:uncharacterized protein (DUF58 family)